MRTSHLLPAAAVVAILLSGCASSPATPRAAANATPSPGLASEAAAAKAPVLTGPEASIPFVNHRDSIRTFHTENDQGIWLQALGGQWYYAQFFAPCIGINFAMSVRYVGNAVDSLDRFSSIYTRATGNCKFTSLRPSEPPPSLTRKPKAAKST
jgi:hypothetical protein